MSKAVYFLHRTRVRDFDTYARDYAQHTVEIVQYYGGQVLAASSQPTALEGTYSGNWVAIMKFPDKASAMGFYDSPRYAALKKARIDQFTDGGEFLMLPAFHASILSKALAG